MAYECGYVLHGLKAQYAGTQPLIQMGVFDTQVVFNHICGETQGAFPGHPSSNEDADEASIVEAVLDFAEAAYAEKLQRIRCHLEAGDSYQVNFTDGVSGEFLGSPIALYRTLISRQPVPYAAYVNGGAYQVLSLSPELFYRCGRGLIVVQPMKGTWPRGVDLEDDLRASQALQNDEKNRAEHITIVDLLRNDLGRVCKLGSVRVDRMMEVTRYNTLHQMTSTISGVPSPEMTPVGVFRTLFPSGSITGAPKLRTMEIIRELERGPRGVYTGAIGYFAPGGEACFSVAIRTLVTEGNRFRLGVGGGITLDSDPTEEYRECKLKASFLSKPVPDFYIFETMRAEAGAIPLLARHLQRLRESSAYFQFHFDEQHVRAGHRAIAPDRPKCGDAGTFNSR